MKRTLLILIPLAVCHLSFAEVTESIAERIAPIGQVDVMPSDVTQNKINSQKPPQVTTVLTSSASTGKKIYTQYCHICHEQGILGAPKFQDPQSWKIRLETKKIEGLTKSAIAGINAMPAKGTCSDCSREDIQSAIEYMLPQ